MGINKQDIASRKNSNQVKGLNLTGQEMIDMMNQAMNYIIRFQDQSYDLPLAGSGFQWIHDQASPTELSNALEMAKSVVEPLPELGTNHIEPILSFLCDSLAKYSTNDNSSGYLAYIPGGGLFHACLADFIGLCLNRYVSIFMAAPGLAAIEMQVIRWICDIIGYPSFSGGSLTTGGSIATFMAIHTARIYHFSNNHHIDQYLKGMIYIGDQTHYCIDQAVKMCGFSNDNLKKIKSSQTNYRIDINALQSSIETDIQKGLIPFAVIGNAGSTGTGAVDDLNALADIAEKYRLWFHVDAAYGGFFMLTQKGKSIMKGIERADSICLDPHKSLFLPYGTGCLLVKHSDILRKAFTYDGSYLPPQVSDNSVPYDLMNFSPELTREFRALRIWLPIKYLGIKPFRDQLEEKLMLAQWMAHELSMLPFIKIVAWPQLSVFTFKIEQKQLKSDELDLLNKQLLNEINKKGRILLTPYKYNDQEGCFSIRIAIVSYRTTREDLQDGLDDIKQAIKIVLS